MWLKGAKFCPQCEWIFEDSATCPRCAGKEWILLEKMLPSLNYDIIFRKLEGVPVQLPLFKNIVRSNGHIREIGFPM